MRLGLASTAVTAALVLHTDAIAKDAVYGPPPEWNRFKALAEPLVRAKLPDPDHWTISWPNGYMPLTWRHKGRFTGYTTCATAHATIPIDGRYPSINFVAVVDYDKVLTIDLSTHENNSWVNVICEDLIKRGMMPPASLMPGAQDQAIARLGMTVRPTPEGAYVVSTTAEGSAFHAGLVQGTVITQANGIALAGIGDAILAILQSGADPLVLTTAAGQTLRIGSGQP